MALDDGSWRIFYGIIHTTNRDGCFHDSDGVDLLGMWRNITFGNMRHRMDVVGSVNRWARR